MAFSPPLFFIFILKLVTDTVLLAVFEIVFGSMGTLNHVAIADISVPSLIPHTLGAVTNEFVLLLLGSKKVLLHLS